MKKINFNYFKHIEKLRNYHKSELGLFD